MLKVKYKEKRVFYCRGCRTTFISNYCYKLLRYEANCFCSPKCALIHKQETASMEEYPGKIVEIKADNIDEKT